jgi:flagellar protein FlaI
MKDKRKEILRDLLGEFATDEEPSNDANDIFGKDTQEIEE